MTEKVVYKYHSLSPRAGIALCTFLYHFAKLPSGISLVPHRLLDSVLFLGVLLSVSTQTGVPWNYLSNKRLAWI